VVIGTKVSANVYNGIYGASHPSSTTPLLPDSAVQWQWSGGVTSDEVTVVAKLRSTATAARLIISDRDDLSNPLATLPVRADDHGVVEFSVDGLQPATQYHYAIAVDGTIDRARVGRLRTYAEGPQSFTVAVGGCARVGSNGAVFDAIRALDPDLYVINGDWHYANLTRNEPEEFREVMDLTLSRAAQAALYRSTPVTYMWDDHDYGGNNADRRSPTRPAAMAVYREYVPHYPLEGADSPVNQAFTIGRVRFLVTDTRSARSPASAPDDADKTMLGATQKAWLKREFLRADADAALTVWVNPTPWIGEATAGADTWAGYSTERRELANFIADNAIDHLLMLSGDAHMVALDDGTNTDYSSTGAGRFPLLHAAALDRPGKVKGGPYSLGVVPGGGQFGVLDVDDRGDSLHVRLSGQNWRGEKLLTYEFDVPASAVGVGGRH
jgi:phosphodiesterase/alkaline phosphatase D-like protein